jgi:hypothetical protein
MHLRGLVFVEEPTWQAVSLAMTPFLNERFDYFWPGGLFDGYLISDDEMRTRTEGAIDPFDRPLDVQVQANCCRSSDLPFDRRSIDFFCTNDVWVSAEAWGTAAGAEDECAERRQDQAFSERLSAAIVEDPQRFVVVMDIHK